MYTAGLFMIFERLNCQTLLFKGIFQTPNFGQRLINKLVSSQPIRMKKSVVSHKTRNIRVFKSVTC